VGEQGVRAAAWRRESRIREAEGSEFPVPPPLLPVV